MYKSPNQLKDAFQKGLRDCPSPKNQDRLSRSYNAVPYPEGLRGWKEIPQVVTAGNVSFPFPQLLTGRELTLLAYEDSLAELNPQTGVETAISTVDAYDTTALKAITAGGVWHWIDLGRVFMLTNGVCVVFKDAWVEPLMGERYIDYNAPIGAPTLSIQDVSPVRVAQDIVLSTFCEWNGIVVSAGFKPTLLWKAAWESFFVEKLGSALTPDALAALSFNIDENFVFWGSPGSSNFSFRWLLYPEEAFGAIFDLLEGVEVDMYAGGSSPLQEALLRADFGMLRVEGRGKVLCVKPHEKGIVVYGTDSIVLLEHHTEPLSTFAPRVLSKTTGIPGRGAVGGDRNTHLFVDTHGCLCLLDSSARIIPLGYEEFFLPLLTEEIVISLQSDPDEPEFYISTASKSYVLTVSGLGECFQRITSIGSYGGFVVCVSDDLEDKTLLVETSEYNGGVEALKAFASVRLVSNRAGFFVGSSKVSYQNNKPPVQTRRRQFNPNGNLILGDAGFDFQLVLETENPSDVLIEQVDLEVGLLDKRFIRAPYGQEANQRSGVPTLGQDQAGNSLSIRPSTKRS